MTAFQRQNSKVALSGLVILVIAVSVSASIYEWMVFATTFVRPGLIGLNSNTVGTDWMVFHGAARSLLGGHQAMMYDGRRFTDFLNHAYRGWLNGPLPFRPWVYPPSYLLLIAPFGLLGFMASLLLFEVGTSAALALAVVVGADKDRRKAWLTAGASVLCPAAALNCLCGQNAMFFTAVLVAGVRLLGARPALAGALLGLLTLKPQFAILAPIALVAGRQWKSLIGFAASAAALVVLSLWAFGVSAWITWTQLTIHSMLAPSSDWIVFGRLWGNSAWTCAVLLGAPASAASALQLAGAIAAAAA
ncbi:MAG TPA: glycosyltransferase family 87 protein, partial [Caulobacteraceae bacterium]|nr:glycosyltransferase family 87 protein [Caulobacteraceae bacterium]